jgi:hypothetical protein
MAKTLDEPIFKTRRCGLVGGRPVGREYMAEIEKRAKRLEDACAGRLEVKPKNKRQLRLFKCNPR